MSSFSSLKFELITTGEQSGTWGNTTNTNIGTAIEQAIVGMATLTSADFTSNVATLTLANVNTAQNARALCLVISASSLSAAGTLNVPAIQKPYLIINNDSYAVTVKVSGLTGVSVPAGKRTLVYNNGTDVGNQVDYLSSLSLGTALPVTSGGTGGTTSTGSGAVVLATSPTLVTPVLGTPTSVTLTNATGLPLGTGVTGTLPVANGGTNLTAFTANGVMYASSTSALATGAVLTFDGSKLGVNGVNVWRGLGAVASNTAVGANALAANTSGNKNVAVGASALRVNTTGGGNTAVGDTAGYSHLTGTYNTGIGSGALFSHESGSLNTAVGANSLNLNVNGTQNTAIGYTALYSNSAGGSNTAIGYGAGYGALGSGNVMLGNRAGLYETGSNSFYVDNQDRTDTAGDKAKALLYGTFSATAASQTLTTNAKFTATYGVVTRVNSQSNTTLTWNWNSDLYDQQQVTALENALTIDADTGNPSNGQQTIFRFTDNGTARALTWTTGASKCFRAIGTPLPTTTVANKTLYVGCVYNSTADRWDVLAVAQET